MFLLISRTTLPQRKERGIDISIKSSPKSSDSDAGEVKKRKYERVNSNTEPDPSVSAKASAFITLSLQEMHEIVRLFTSSPPGCVDWGKIAEEVTNGRLSMQDVEYVANEFLPHVHYRPSLGMILMERHSKFPSEYQKHKLTMKRMKQGIVALILKLKAILGKDIEEPAAPTIEGEISTPLDVDMKPAITPLSTPDEEMGESANPAPSVEPGTSSKRTNIENYLSSLPKEVADELQMRADKAIDRFIRGEVPVYAMRSAPLANIDAEAGNLTATGRIRKRYETKAMRLAREAAGMKSDQPTPQLAPVASPPGAATGSSTFTPPPFFLQTAAQFARSTGSVDNDLIK